MFISSVWVTVFECELLSFGTLDIHLHVKAHLEQNNQ